MNLHYGEVGLSDGQLVTSGKYGWTMVVTGVGDTIGAAQKSAYARAAKVFVPNLRYRRDIGDMLAARNLQTAIREGHLAARRIPTDAAVERLVAGG